MRRIIDLHCDTMMACYFSKAHLDNHDGHINTEKLLRGGCLSQAFALFLPTDGKKTRDRREPWDLYKDMLECWNEEIDANSKYIRRAYTADDIDDNDKNGYMSALLTVEDGIGIDGKASRVQEMYKDGVRMLALTWNFENCIGFPNSADPELHRRGLKPFGKETVEQMNELGMIIDVSHLSEGGFYDVAEISQVPFIASHSCARALRDHPRNLTDDQLKTLADHGGVVGMNFCSDFLSEDSEHTHAEDIVKHMVHIRNVAGIESMAWGSDFDGIEPNLDFKDYAGFPTLLDLMSKEFTASEMDKINHENFMRVMKDAGL